MTSPPNLWDGVLRRLGTETAPLAFEAWIHPLRVREEPERLVLLAPTAFHRERVRTRYAERISTLVAELGGRPLELSIEVGAEETAAACGSAAAPRVSANGHTRRPALRSLERVETADRHAAQLVLPSTFETFVTGPANALAREASFAIARGSQPALFPLFLAGASGTGKSHLARAVVAEARQQGVERALYVSAERFTTDFTSAVRSRHGGEFRRRYRQECDLLVLEDVQFLAGKRQTQLELFHVLEHLRAVGGRLLLTGDRLPRQIPELCPRLASQLAGGLVAELELPDRALRRAILRDRASRGGMSLPVESLELLVEGVRGSVRDLEGALTQLVASASLLGRPIDRELTEAALRKVGRAPAGAARPRRGDRLRRRVLRDLARAARLALARRALPPPAPARDVPLPALHGREPLGDRPQLRPRPPGGRERDPEGRARDARARAAPLPGRGAGRAPRGTARGATTRQAVGTDGGGWTRARPCSPRKRRGPLSSRSCFGSSEGGSSFGSS